MLPRKLPAPLVSRLKRTYPLLRPRLHKMKNVDHRAKKRFSKSVEELAREAYPIVELDVSRHSDARVVVKVLRGHKGGAEAYVEEQAARIEAHNREHPDEPYELVRADLHAIGHDAVAMPFVDAPSLNEILNGNTERGKRAAESLFSKGFDLNKIANIGERARWNSGFYERNLFYLGLRKGRPVLSPLGELKE